VRRTVHCYGRRVPFAYVGQGLGDDLPLLESKPEVDKLLESLRKQGVKESLIEKALVDAGVSTA